ncbi:hypothetical protein IV203_027811 [Nitzschia inconspicua]|uniref:Uncharacterized protein n=1 Tax=Nitzschia inconspicua TaxID=303405 RepID=A0A9K3LYF8_9STRA|nr:hypothetical protein IV203_027811 [Nitzschia inconspicua]
MYNKEVLMAGAKPHNKAAEDFENMRKLGNNFEITADYSIQFISCFSLSTSYDELFENNQNNGGSIGLTLMSKGKAVPERSYAIFKLCYSSHCDYTGNDPSLEYVIDLSVYVQALVMYLPEQVENFCEGCQQNQDACYAQLYGGYGYAGMYGYNGQAYQQSYSQEQQQQAYNYQNVNNVQYSGANAWTQGYNYYGNNQQQANAQQMSNNNGNRRSLADLHNAESRQLENGQTVRQLDCNLCLQYNCIAPQNGGNYNQDMYGFEAAAEWLTTISQCYQTGAVYSQNGAYYQQGGNNQGNMYAGFICNDEGTGVEIGMFLDEECILYLPEESFETYMNLYDSTYQSMTEDIIEFTFSAATFSCKDEEVVYTTQNVDGYQYNYQNYNANDKNEAAGWCQYLYDNELGAYPVGLYDCGGKAYGNYYGYNLYDDDNQYKNIYSWYQYEINEANSIDMQEVCMVVKKANGNLHTFYNGNTGHLYKYGSSGSNIPDSVNEFVEGTGTSSVSYKKGNADLSGAAKFGIIAAVGVVVGAIVAAVIKVRSGSSDKTEPLMEGELDEKEEGTMA